MLVLNLNSFGRRVEDKRHNEENRSGDLHPAPASPAPAGRPQPGGEVCPPENSQSFQISLKSRPFGSQADDNSDLNIAMLDLWEARTGFERQRPTAVTQMTIFPMLWSTKSPFYADKTSDGCGCRVKIFKSCKRKTSPVLTNNSSSGSAIALRCIPATGTQDF